MSPSRPEPIRAALARRAPPGPATNPGAPRRYGLPDDHAAPSPPRRPRCNLPARCDAPPARISVRPSTDDASTSTPVDVVTAMTQQEARELLTGLTQTADRRQTGAHEI